ncbi:ureidoglycolate lyase [uncultured Thiothrix sp.]|uniref:ureidoglycolate lyase n=1 Tax=uncultured Thiothrix sp. TaxID=223185 RepID=UPI0026085B7B|nr:ureidoglycolate lyase [uncultured Thiothrix sp.]
MAYILKPELLTAAAFAPFGDVIETTERDFYLINYGKTERYSDLANLDTLDNAGKPTVSIFRSQPVQFPFRIEVMERHPQSSQAFISLERKPFFTVVAPVGDQPLLGQIRLFLVGAQQGINYRRGVWHHYMFSPEDVRDFICLDRTGGTGNNCDEYRFSEEILIEAC